MRLEFLLPHILALERLVFDENLSWDNGYTVKSGGHFHAIKANFQNTSQKENLAEVNSLQLA